MPRVVGRGKSRAEVEATLLDGLPSEDLFALGDPADEDGESSTMLLLLVGGSAEGAAGESSKYVPSPGESSIDPARDVQGECGMTIARKPNAGESTSMASLAAVLD